jgi:hypothetical protein
VPSPRVTCHTDTGAYFLLRHPGFAQPFARLSVQIVGLRRVGLQSGFCARRTRD